MARDNEVPSKFKPERPIYLSESNTAFKTKDEVLYAIEQLRAKGYLCTYGDFPRPIHMSFISDPSGFQEFKKACSQLKITLKEPTIHADDMDEFEDRERKNIIIPEEPKSTHEDPSGTIHIES